MYWVVAESMQTGSVMFHCKYSRHRSVLRSLAAPLTHARDRSVSRYTTNGDPWDLYAAAVVHEESGLIRTDTVHNRLDGALRNVK
jgi:hypothetical protein